MKEIKLKNIVVWAFVDDKGENYFNYMFVDKASAELMGKRLNVKGKAICVSFSKIKTIKGGF